MLVKEDELARVQARAKDVSACYNNLRTHEEELRNAVQSLRRANQDMALGIARKEKEIQRLVILTERNKRASMSMRGEVVSQRKVLEVFANTLTDKKPKLDKIIDSCDEIVHHTPMPSPPPPGVCSTSTPPSPLSLTPVSPPGIAGAFKAASTSPFQEEMNKLVQENSHKEQELSRVSAIADIEAVRVAALKEKSEEVKMVIADELQSLDEQIEFKLQQIRSRQDAVKKVVSRAESERARACKVQEELDNLVKIFNEEKSNGIEIKKSEYLPDKAYFAEFKELTELVPVAEIGVHPAAARVGLALDVDPLALIQSPRLKQISFTHSQDVLALKMRDIGALEQHIVRLDEELVRVKNLKEAEVARRRLFAEKLRDVKDEVDYIRTIRSHGREVSRTF